MLPLPSPMPLCDPFPGGNGDPKANYDPVQGLPPAGYPGKVHVLRLANAFVIACARIRHAALQRHAALVCLTHVADGVLASVQKFVWLSLCRVAAFQSVEICVC